MVNNGWYVSFIFSEWGWPKNHDISPCWGTGFWWWEVGIQAIIFLCEVKGWTLGFILEVGRWWSLEGFAAPQIVVMAFFWQLIVNPSRIRVIILSLSLYTYVHTHIYIYVCICICMYVYMYVYVCICTGIYIYLYISGDTIPSNSSTHLVKSQTSNASQLRRWRPKRARWRRSLTPRWIKTYWDISITIWGYLYIRS